MYPFIGKKVLERSTALFLARFGSAQAARKRG
jgi:hypothetical protein